MFRNDHPLLTIAATLGFLTTAYTLTPSDNLTRHCTEEEKSTFESDKNLCFIHQYKDQIKRTAQNYQLPPELIGALLYQENDWRLKIQDLADTTSNVAGRIHTAGPAQVRTTTAHRLDHQANEINKQIIREYHSILNEPENAIEYMAKELHYLAASTPNLSPTSIEGQDLLASQYRTGLQANPTPNQHGYDVLIILQTGKIYHALEMVKPNRLTKDTYAYIKETRKNRVE